MGRYSSLGLRALAIAATVILVGNCQAPDAQERARTASACTGTYADDLMLLSPDARRKDEATRYAYALRSRAVYQCPYFDREGTLRRRKENVVSHGTAFALRRDSGFTYLISNEHVTEWPQVTTPEDHVDGIPLGCKRLSDRMSLVDNEADEYEADDIEVQRVLVDAELDLSIVKTNVKLQLLPSRMGRSTAVRAGNAVVIRGFPLGAFSALSTGKVTNSRQRDEELGWSHTDMVVDAQLSRGHSGSPVLAVSCATRELELVGLYHAGYKEGASLNVAIGVDELRDVITSLRPRKRTEAQHGPSEPDRLQVEAALAAPSGVPFVPFGALTIGLRRGQEGVIFYDVYGKRFPLTDRRLFVLEDQAQRGSFGLVDRAWIGSNKGLCELKLERLEEPDRALVARAVTALREQLLRTVRFRELDASPDKSYARYEKQRALEAELQRGDGARRELSRTLADLLERTPADSLGACGDPGRLVSAPPASKKPGVSTP